MQTSVRSSQNVTDKSNELRENSGREDWNHPVCIDGNYSPDSKQWREKRKGDSTRRLHRCLNHPEDMLWGTFVYSNHFMCVVLTCFCLSESLCCREVLPAAKRQATKLLCNNLQIYWPLICVQKERWRFVSLAVCSTLQQAPCMRCHVRGAVYIRKLTYNCFIRRFIDHPKRRL